MKKKARVYNFTLPENNKPTIPHNARSLGDDEIQALTKFAKQLYKEKYILDKEGAFVEGFLTGFVSALNQFEDSIEQFENGDDEDN